MSGLFEDAPGRWGLVFHGDGHARPAHTRSGWACIARAIAGADTGLANFGNPASMRGDGAWCQTALGIFTQLRDAAAFGELDDTAGYCFADRTAIRAWLRAPVVPVDAGRQTMLEAEGLGLAFPADTRTDPLALPLLVERAQDVGVFGVPGNHVQLWPCVGSRATQPYTYTLTISPLAAGGLSGWPTYLGHMLNHDRPQTDTIVSALSQIADLANLLLDNARTGAARLASTVEQALSPYRVPGNGDRLDQRARGFPGLSTRDIAGPTMPPPVSGLSPGHNDRRNSR